MSAPLLSFNTLTGDDLSQDAVPLAPFQVQLVLCHSQGILDPAAEPPLTISTGRDFLIGRDVNEARDLRLADPQASREHAALTPQEGHLHLRDLGSKNGTFVNGVRISKTAVRPGDVLRIGGSLLVVQQDPPRPSDGRVPGLLGADPATRGLRATLCRLAQGGGDLLLLGESGTGKDLLARAFHTQSGRSGRLITINCGAIHEALADSLLFGIRDKTATDVKAQSGYLRDAHQGTLFLDEIGDLSLTLQPKLLRVLENREVLPVGVSQTERVDVKIVAATHKDLAAEARAGRFRPDLYARLAVRQLTVPPLRQRRRDILWLLRHFLPQPTPPLSALLGEQLLLHPWPLNIRGLKALAAVLSEEAAQGETLRLSMAEAWLAQDRRLYEAASSRDSPAEVAPPDEPRPRGAPTPDELSALMLSHQGKIMLIAATLGYSRRHTLRLIRAYGLDLQRARGDA